MKLIMLKDHKNVGKKDEVVEVSDGFGQNFLINKGISILASEQNLKRRSERLLAQEERNEHSIKESTSLKIEIEDIVISLSRDGNNGKMFGSITSSDISEELSTLDIDVSKKKIKLDKIYTFGEYVAIIDCGNSISAELKIYIEVN